MVVFQALTWESKDTDDEHLISIFGKTEDGKSVCLTTSFYPYFFIKLPQKIDNRGAALLYTQLCKECPDTTIKYDVIQSKDVWGFQNNEKFSFMQVHFKNLVLRRQVANRLKRALPDNLYKLKVYESNIYPVLRLMHRTGIQSTGWLDSGDNCVNSNIANTDIDIFCIDWKTLKPYESRNMAPFIVASVDIECNSSTGKFPDAEVPDDACFQICLLYTSPSPRDRG